MFVPLILDKSSTKHEGKFVPGCTPTGWHYSGSVYHFSPLPLPPGRRKIKLNCSDNFAWTHRRNIKTNETAFNNQLKCTTSCLPICFRLSFKFTVFFIKFELNVFTTNLISIQITMLTTFTIFLYSTKFMIFISCHLELSARHKETKMIVIEITMLTTFTIFLFLYIDRYKMSWSFW